MLLPLRYYALRYEADLQIASDARNPVAERASFLASEGFKMHQDVRQCLRLEVRRECSHVGRNDR